MATIKNYTDIEQSKKLAEILPIDSADAMYPWRELIKDYDSVYVPEDMSDIGEEDIPCWSLAALLNVIPQEIFDGEYVINITEGRVNRWVLTYDHCENRNHSYYGLSPSTDNLVDACYSMIIKLKERNLL